MTPCIDCHAHFLPDAYIDELARRGLAQPDKKAAHLDLARDVCGYAADRTRLPYYSALYNLDERVARAEADRIDRQIVCLPPFFFAYKAEPEVARALCRAGNEALAATVARAPKTFASFATVPLQSPAAAVAELRYAVEELGHWGVEIGSSIAGAPLDDPALEGFWAACCELGVPIFLHPHHELGGERAKAYYLGNLFGNPSETGLIGARLIFSGLFERFPDLHMILAHAGGMLPYLIGRLDHGWEVRPETKALPKPPSAYLHRFFFDTITHDDALLAYLVGRVGWRQVVVGTDRPYDMGIDDPRATVAHIPHLSEEQRDGIVGANALGILHRAGQLIRTTP